MLMDAAKVFVYVSYSITILPNSVLNCIYSFVSKNKEVPKTYCVEREVSPILSTFGLLVK